MTMISVSSVIDAPVAEVWAKIRDFNALPDWHPAIAESHVENGEPSDRVGCVRNFTLVGDGTIRERLLGLDDVEHVCTYSILNSSMPVENYVAAFRLRPVTDGDRTYAEWTARFDCPPKEEDALIKLISQGVFQAGWDALKRHFAK
ncbi:MAG: SRPBCC family protein [Pirellulales bacterium]|nr:SRPBCC family protein [Pirellulales bacterium]